MSIAIKEHACLRLQASLAGKYGLRRFLAPTTDHRAYYDQLPDDPLSDRYNTTVTLARRAMGLSDKRPWAPYLHRALKTTASMATAAARFGCDSESLYAVVDDPPAPHPAGGWQGDTTKHCQHCVWFGETRNFCMSHNQTVTGTSTACTRWEGQISCDSCGACCREGFDSVTIEDNDPVLDAHPELAVLHERYTEIARDGHRCAALQGSLETRDFRCRIYQHRPTCCRELVPAGEHCLTARRRVGLSD